MRLLPRAHTSPPGSTFSEGQIWAPHTWGSHSCRNSGQECSMKIRDPAPSTLPLQAPKCQWQGSSAFLFKTPALAEKLLSPAILSHPADFSKHPPIKLHKYIHLVNIPLTRSAYSVHNLLWSSTKSVTEAIMQF